MLIQLDYGDKRPGILEEIADLNSARRRGWKWPCRRHLYGNEYAWTVDRLRDHLGADLTGKLVMDAGGGNSALQHYIRLRGADVINVSRVIPGRGGPGMIRGVTDRGVEVPPTRLLGADLIDTGLELGSFDAIVSVSAIEHNAWGEIESIVAHLLDLLKPGAPLIVTVPAGRKRAWYPRGSFPGFAHFPDVYLFDVTALGLLAHEVAAEIVDPAPLGNAFAYRLAWDVMKNDMDTFIGGHRRPYLSAGFVLSREVS